MTAPIVLVAAAKGRPQNLRRVAEQRHRDRLQGHPHLAGRRTGLRARS